MLLSGTASVIGKCAPLVGELCWTVACNPMKTIIYKLLINNCDWICLRGSYTHIRF